MADPSGQYTFFYDKSTGTDILDIQVDAAGNQIHSTLFGDSITGSYDRATRKLRFGHSGALLSSARKYVGYAILDQAGSVCALVGIVHGFEFTSAGGRFSSQHWRGLRSLQ